MKWRHRHPKAYAWSCGLAGGIGGYGLGWFGARGPQPWGIMVVLTAIGICLALSMRALRDTRRHLRLLAMIQHAVQTEDPDLLEVVHLELDYHASSSRGRLFRRSRK